jgi:hypothetical protein
MVVVSAVGFVAAFSAAVGCAGGVTGDEPLSDGSTTQPAEAGASSSSGGKVLPPKKDSGPDQNPPGDDDDTTTGDDDDVGGPTDGGTDAGVDSGPPPPPPPVENTPCTTQDQIVKVACGFCGTKTTVCEKKADGSLGWSGYSPCDGEHGVCAAGDVQTEACNNCGTRTITCSSSCTWSAGQCSAAANTGCAPLTYDITNAGCGGADLGLYRVRQCSETCGYGSYSTCSAAPTSIEVGPTVGAVSSTVAQLGGSITKIGANSCPVTTLSNIATAYAYTVVHNPLDAEVTVIIYNSIAPAGKVFETALAVYAGDSAPTTVDARKQCIRASTAGNATYTGDAKFASLDTVPKKVAIPGKASVIVYTAAESASDSGPVRVNVKTDAITKPAPPSP